MRAYEFINEGGWDTVATQSTIVTPAVVDAALKQIQRFTADFNQWLEDKGLPPVEMGHPTGSSAYYQVDDQDKVYGDVDLQMIAHNASEAKTHAQFQGFWNKMADQFVSEMQPAYVLNTESKPGHPIVAIGQDKYVQVDFMWHEHKLKDWGRFRVTPERGVKGLLTGNMFSVLGELLGMSIQHAGVQIKMIDNNPVAFTRHKGTKVYTIATNPSTFILDIYNFLCKRQGVTPEPSTLLKSNAGLNTQDVKISGLVNGVKGFAESAEASGLFGNDLLAGYSGARDFIARFFARYEEKAMNDVNSAKRSKAETPDAIARAEADRQKILSGLDMVRQLFGR